MSDIVEKCAAVWDRNALAKELADAAIKLVEQAARIEQLEAALREADKGLTAMIQQYASRAFGQSIVAGDEQYPWVRLAMIGSDAARAALGEKE